MLTALLLSAYCFSLVGSLSINLIPDIKYIDGTQFTIKSVATTYIQRVNKEGTYCSSADRENECKQGLRRYVLFTQVDAM